VRNESLSAKGNRTRIRDDAFWSSKVPTGNSRDKPTPFEFCCEKCSQYKTISQASLKTHTDVCKGPSVKLEKTAKCPHEDCGKSYVSDKALENHVRNTHGYRPRKCAILDCSDKIFTNGDQWSRHLQAKHSHIDPTRCKVPDCSSKLVYTTNGPYIAHLRTVHKLHTCDSRKPYISEHKKTDSAFPTVVCPIGNGHVRKGAKECTDSWESRVALQHHLQSQAHGMSKEEARDVVDQVARSMYVLVQLPEKKGPELEE